MIKDFLKQQGADTALLFPDRQAGEIEIGSNMWAFAPSRSRSGQTILMGNPHQPWAPVSTYYEAHLIVPGKLNFYGSTFIGRPVLTTGWNEQLGWSHTVNYPDLEEIYELTSILSGRITTDSTAGRCRSPRRSNGRHQGSRRPADNRRALLAHAAGAGDPSHG